MAKRFPSYTHDRTDFSQYIGPAQSRRQDNERAHATFNDVPQQSRKDSQSCQLTHANMHLAVSAQSLRSDVTVTDGGHRVGAEVEGADVRADRILAGLDTEEAVDRFDVVDPLWLVWFAQLQCHSPYARKPMANHAQDEQEAEQGKLLVGNGNSYLNPVEPS